MNVDLAAAGQVVPEVETEFVFPKGMEFQSFNERIEIDSGLLEGNSQHLRNTFKLCRVCMHGFLRLQVEFQAYLALGRRKGRLMKEGKPETPAGGGLSADAHVFIRIRQKLWQLVFTSKEEFSSAKTR